MWLKDDIKMKGIAKLLQNVKTVIGLDRAIAFSVAGRGWLALASVVNITLIARFLTPGQQGYYYTFYSLVGLQIIFELGFSFVVLQLAAHERASVLILDDGKVEGNERSLLRLASVLQKAVRWYSCGSVVLAVALLTIGFHFFSREHGANSESWKLPWTLVVLASSLTFQIDPIVSFLEGCGKVVDVGALRLAQSVIGGVLSWIALMLKHGLYSPALIILGQAIAGSFFLFQNRRLLLSLLRVKPGLYAVSWSKEIWPFQWRIAISWASAYFIWQILNPIVFAYRGPAEAGRLGMSLNIANSLGAFAISWMATKASPFGILVANRKYSELDHIFFRALKQSTAVLAIIIVTFLSLLPIVFHFVPLFRLRVLPIPLFSILFMTALLAHVVVSEAYYLRAHKKEPFLVFWVAIAVLSVIGVSFAAKYSGVTGVVLVYFVCSGVLRFVAANVVFSVKRRQWHSEETILVSD
jgi:hypothetical protein